MNEVEKAEHAALFALFLEHHANPNGYIDLEDLYRDYHLKFPKEWLQSSLSEWADAGWVDVAQSHDNTSAILNSNRYNAVLKRLLDWLGASSLTVRAKGEEIYSDVSPANDIPMRDGWKWFTYASDPGSETATSTAPASDRVVPLSHNEPDYLVVERGIRELSESIRSTNDLEATPEERDQVLAGLTAAAALWSAAQLKVVQIKVGVVMAIEDAGRLLTNTAKAVAVALFVDAIKSIVKNHVGVDLDKL